MAELETMPIFQPKEERAKTLLLNILGLATGDLTHPEETRKEFVYAATFELLEIIREGNAIDEHLQWLVYSETENWQNGFERYKTKVLDLSKDSAKEDECLDLAKNIYDALYDFDKSMPEMERELLKKWISEMVTGDLEDYPLPIIETFLCKPENAAFIPQFKELLKGDYFNENQ
jgi:hypothetical protein